jgi:cell wall-associated NlpC family hydrolase
MMNRSLVIGLLFFLAVPAAQGDDDTWNNIYHSVSRFGDNVRNTFTEDAGDRPSPTPKRHRKPNSKHSSLKKTKAEPSASPSVSPVEKSDASDDTSGAGSEKSTPSSSSTPVPAEEGGSASKNKPENAAPMATIKPEALREFATQPPQVQQLITNALALTEQNLGYKYGAADPSAGGMDCSGFIFYVLSNAGYKDVPRDSSGQYAWVRKSSDFHAVLSRSGESFELDELKPGDLMFWSGTYKIDRDIPITHVMIYLGKEKSTGKPVMVGATDGRTYDGVRRFGVSVFDFKMPSSKPNKDDPALTAKFEGYATIPGLREPGVAAKNRDNLEQGIKSEKATPNAKQKTKPLSDGGDGD